MFASIRRRLTFLYTVLTTLTLAGFALLFYIVLSTVLLQEKERDLQLFASHIAHEAVEVLKRGSDHNRDDERKHGREARKKFKPPLPDSHVIFLVNRHGEFVGPEAVIPGARPPQEVLSSAIAGEVRSGDGALTGVEGEKHYLWIVRPLKDDGRWMGSLIAGRDLAEHDHFLAKLAQLLGVSLLVFPLLAGVIGYFAAGRAMMPIRQSFDAQRRFAADASHELRTPLSVIQASLDVVEKEDAARLSTLSRQIFDDLKDEIRRMARLTGDLLTLARSDAGGIKLTREQFALGPVLEHVGRIMEPLAEHKGVKLSVAASGGVMLRADRDRIEQLLLILTDNGVKFTPAGGEVRLSAERRKDGAIILSVADSGVGVQQEDREKIFERFYRVDKARSREEGGAGLGLSIAAWIVGAHGGKISAEPRAEGGSIFCVTLPQESI